MAIITELADFGSTAFFDNRTWLNQENWQAYFGGSLPSGVVVDGKLGAEGQFYTDALSMRTVNASYKAFNPGTVIINGIFAKYTANTYIPVIKAAEIDRLIVARVYLLAGLVKIVGKTKVAQEAGFTTNVYADMLLKDESLGCVRTDTYYEIPLCYEVYGANTYDLRRLYYLPSKANPFLTVTYNGMSASAINPDAGVLFGQGFVNVYGGMNYDIQIDSEDTTNGIFIYPAPSCSEKPTVLYIKNNSNVDKQIRFPLIAKGLAFSYEWIDNWNTEEVAEPYKYRTLVAQDKIALMLTPFKASDSYGYTVSSKGGMTEGFDPEDYYTKQETSVLLAQRVAKDYVDGKLAEKANIADLGDLAYQNTANYQTQLTNKPTLGALASKDTVALGSEVSGILPVKNGGTGANSLAGLQTIVASLMGTSDIYVNSASGSDSTGEGTSAKPFATMQKAINFAPSHGFVIIHVLPGTYRENLSIASKKIRIIGLSNSEIIFNNISVVNYGALELYGRFTVGAIEVTDGSDIIYRGRASGDSLNITGSDQWGYNVKIRYNSRFTADDPINITPSSSGTCINIETSSAKIYTLSLTSKAYILVSGFSSHLICKKLTKTSTYTFKTPPSSDTSSLHYYFYAEE